MTDSPFDQMDKKPIQSQDSFIPTGAGITRYMELYSEYINAKMRYYRDVLRTQDQEYIRMLSKVPDDWDDYQSGDGADSLPIREDTKIRLSDIKKGKSREIQYESLHVSSVVAFERQLMDCFHFIPLDDEGCREGIDAANGIINDTAGDIETFKSLLLSLAKRSVSDLYYLMIAYNRFFKKLGFRMEEHFADFCREAAAIIKDQGRDKEILADLGAVDAYLGSFFTRSAQITGWRFEEVKLKQKIDTNEYHGALRPERLTKSIMAAHSLKNRIKKNYDFIVYYHNPRDGKGYRYSYITESLTRKFEERKLSRRALDGFREIHKNFSAYVAEFDRGGLENFGPPGHPYVRLLEFIFKAGKVLEFVYLRSMMYNELNEIRSTVLRQCEQELVEIRETAVRQGRAH